MTAHRGEGARAASLALAAVLLAQVAIGAHYVARTGLVDRASGARVFVLWDDAMISMRYARNLAAGDGLVWNPGGEAVQGYTNLGLTLAMAGVHALGARPETASLWIQLLALAALVATSALAARLATDLARRASGTRDAAASETSPRARGGEEWAGVGAALALLVCAPHQIFALQGADTIFVATCLFVAAASFARARRLGAIAVGALAAAVLVRPDATLFALAAAAVAAWTAAPGARGRAAAPTLAAIAALWIALVAFGLAYYGDPLPNTYYLKATGSPLAKVLASGVDQLLAFGWRWLPALALAAWAVWSAVREPAPPGAPATAHTHARAHPEAVLLAAFVALATAYHVQVGGDWVRDYGSRYLVQVLPAVAVLAAAGAFRAVARAPAAVRAAFAVAAPVLAFAAGGPPAAMHEWTTPSAPTLFHAENQGNFERARFLQRATRGDTLVAAHWAGIGPYFAERPSVDVLGRADRHIAHLEVDRFIPGHSKWDWDYVLDVVRPDLIDFGSRGLRDHPSFRRDYAALVVGPQAVLFVRRESLPKILDPTLLVVPLADLLPPLEDEPGDGGDAGDGAAG